MRKKIISIVYALLLTLVISGCVAWIPTFEKEPLFQEITVDESLFEDKFYYEQLSEDEQLAYKEIYQGISEMQEEIYVHCDNGEKANSIFRSVIYDFPEIFWSDSGSTLLTYDEGYTVISPKYVCTNDEKVQKEAEIEAELMKILDGIPVGYSEYEKIKYIYEYLIESADYVIDAPDSQNLYSALVNKETVCAGYAKANQYLLNRLGIYCTYVIGTAEGENGQESHAWNIVRCDNQFYHVDITWADPLSKEEEQFTSSNIIYDYLCCSESTLAATHQLDSGYDYPECYSDDLNYYRLNQMFYETADEKQLLKAMYDSIDAKESSITFKFATQSTYTEGKELLLDRLISDAIQYLGKRYRLYEVGCYYQEQDRLNKFVIYWNYE